MSAPPVVKAGAFVLWRERFLFMFGPTAAGDALGVVRIGGHVKKGESPWACAQREAWEEARVRIRALEPPATYRADSENRFAAVGNLEQGPLPASRQRTAPGQRLAPGQFRAFPPPIDPRPFIVAERPAGGGLTYLYLAATEDAPVPDHETCGLLLPTRAELARLVRDTLTLGDYLSAGGRAICRDALPRTLMLLPSVHLHLLDAVLRVHPELAP